MKLKLLFLVGCLLYSISNLLYSQKNTAPIFQSSKQLSSEMRLWFEAVSLQNSDVVLGKEKALEAYEMAKALKDDRLLLNSVHLLGSYHHQLGQNKTALEYLYPAVILANDLKVPQAEVSILNKIGEILMEKGDFSNALISYQKALSIEQSVPESDALKLTNCHIAKYYIEKKNTEKAISYLKEGINVLQSNKTPVGIAHLYLEKGYLNLLEKDYFNAIEHLRKSLSILQQNKLVYKEAIVNEVISQVHYQEHRYEAALQFANTALKIHQGLKINKHLVKGYNQKGLIHLKMKQANMALKSFQKALKIVQAEETPSIQLSNTHRLLYLALTNLGRLEEAHEHLKAHQILEEVQHNKIVAETSFEVVQAKFTVKEGANLAAKGNGLFLTVIFLLSLLGFGFYSLKRLIYK